MPELDPPSAIGPLATSRRWLFSLAGLLLILTLGVMATAAVGSMIQTGVRAYVGGEGLWSKAQKDAVIALERYATSHDEGDWVAYRAHLEVIFGDRRARLELEKAQPDDAIVTAGFLTGGNAAEDIPSLVMLFRTFRQLSYIDRAITIWTDGDMEIDRLDAIALEIRMAVARNDVTAVNGLRSDVDAANDRLTLLEDDFSQTLGEAARWVQTILLLVMAAILLLLTVITMTVGRFIIGRLRAADLRTAETLRASEARLRLVVDHLPAIVWTTDVDLVMTSITGDGLARLNLEESSIIGRPLLSLFQPDLHMTSEDGVVAERAHRDALRGESASYRTAVADRTIQAHIEPLLVGGRVIGVIGLGLDLTDRLKLEARLESTTRLESIGRLAGGVAHDFNNLLTAISGYADLLANSLPDGDQRHDAEEIRRAALRATDLTAQLLAFGRRQALKPELICANEVVGEMQRMLGRLIGDDIVLELDLDAKLPMVMADPGQLEQVILNLAVNARDAMPTGGQLTISTRRTTIPAGPAPHPAGAARVVPGVAISVRDTGVGMDETTRIHIFEPFFTTKPRGKGTGLGLSTVHGIVEQSGGTIEVESVPGVGSTFTMVLAATSGAVAAADGGPNSATAAAGAAPAGRPPIEDAPPVIHGPHDDPDRRPVILVAEDEAAVRELVVRVLGGAGYAVIAARDGLEAIRLAEHLPRIDALLSDVIMPHVSGLELATALRERLPELPVLFMSGFTGDILGEGDVVPPGIDLLAKPFGPTELVDRVRMLLQVEAPPISSRRRPATARTAEGVGR